jgi:ABC-type branched-subunit amino acid transport system permease subunit
VSYYASILLTYFFVDVVAALGLDFQVGLSGIINFGFILFQAAGAYTMAVATLGPPSTWSGTQIYFAGWSLPFPLPFVLAILVGVTLSFLAGMLVLRRLRSTYQAIVLLSLMLVCYNVVVSTPRLFNGTTGLGSVPHPLQSALGLSFAGYQWAYALFCGVVCAVVFALVRIVYRSPFGRLLAASREGESACAALGRNVFRMRLVSMMVGGGLAALSGAMLVGSVTAWSPNSWFFFETISYFAAITLGGVGNGFGTLLGVAVLQIGIMQGVTYLPNFGPPGFTEYLQQAILGIALITVLWLRPQGLLPERRPRLLGEGKAGLAAGAFGHFAGSQQGSPQ